VHAAYRGRVYYWLKGPNVASYHFGPHYIRVPETSWYSEDGEEMTAGGYNRKSKRYRTPERGQTFNLAKDFVRCDIDWWKGGDLIVPKAKLFVDKTMRHER